MLVCLLFAGCGGSSSDVKLYPVKGTLKKGGKPLEGIKVLLETDDPKMKAPLLFGIPDATGNFEIQTSTGAKGAPLGSYKVVISPPPAEMDYAKMAKGGPKKNTDLIPKNYQSASTTMVSYDVKADSKPLEIEIP